MARTIGTVTKASGQVQVKKAEGNIEMLRVGSPIEENDVVMTEGLRSEVTLQLEGGREIIIGGNEEVLIDQSVFAAVDEGMSVDVEALQAALAAGGDPSDLEATAAGEETLGASVAEGFVAERGDARGDVEASLRPTEFDNPSATFIVPEGAEVPPAPDAPVPEEPEEPVGPENAAPDAIDDGDATAVEFYTVHLGGKGGWEGVEISAYRGYGEYPSDAEVWSAGNDDNGQGEGLYGKLGVYDSDVQGNPQPLVDNMTDGPEWLEFSFDGPLNHAEVELSSFNTSNSNGENSDDDAVYWAIYDSEGALLASDTYTGEDLTKDGNVDILTIDSDTPFTTLVIGAPEVEGDGHHDNFFVEAINGWGGEIGSDYTLFEDDTLMIPEEMLLANDSDPDGDPLSVIDFDASDTIGSVSWDQDAGEFTYDPAGQFNYLGAGETATDTFSYTISDGALTDTAIVTINIVGLDNGTVEFEYQETPSDYPA